MRLYMTYIGCFSRKHEACIGEWICPHCKSQDVTGRLGEYRHFCDGDSITYENAYDMRCNSCGHYAEAGKFFNARINVDAALPPPDHDALQTDQQVSAALAEQAAQQAQTIYL